MRLLAALLTTLLVGTLSASALAGAPIRLRLEIPPDVTKLAPGERLDPVQVVGIDADGARVGLADRKVVVSASAGTVESISPPYRWAFVAPAAVEGDTTVILTARLDDAPQIRGTLSIPIETSGAYARLLVLPRDAMLGPGGVTEISVLGQRAGSGVVPVVDRRVEMTLDGPGRLEFVRLGTFRYHAPASLEGVERVVRLNASFTRDETLRGEASIRLSDGRPLPTEPDPRPAVRPTKDAAGGRPKADPPSGDKPAPTPGQADAEPDAKPDAKGTTGGSAEPAEPAESDESAEDAPSKDDLIWPGGHLRVTSWRARSDADDGWPRRLRRLPEAGGQFAAPDAFQKLRLVVLTPDVRAVDATWRSDEGDVAADAVVLRSQRNKAGALVVQIEASPPEDGRPLRVTLSLERAAGDPIAQTFVFRRKTRKVHEGG